MQKSLFLLILILGLQLNGKSQKTESEQLTATFHTISSHDILDYAKI